jgi:hypothetical protein
MERGGISARWWLYFTATTIFYYLLISKVILGHFLTGESQDVPDPPPSRRMATEQGGSRPARGPSKGPRNIKQSSRVECSQCNKTFAHASYLAAHKAIHLGKWVGKIQWDIGNITGKNHLYLLM